MDKLTLSKNWHLAETEEEVKATEFEFLLWRLYHGFVRWQEDCENAVNSSDLSAGELAVLHIIGMKQRPKTIYEIAQLLYRTDFPNVQYSIKKLLKLELIEKSKKTVRKSAAYQVTDLGLKDIEAYTIARRKILIELFSQETELEGIIDKMLKLSQVYEEASRIVVSYQDIS